jgi:hypothetical protein
VLLPQKIYTKEENTIHRRQGFASRDSPTPLLLFADSDSSTPIDLCMLPSTSPPPLDLGFLRSGSPLTRPRDTKHCGLCSRAACIAMLLRFLLLRSVTASFCCCDFVIVLLVSCCLCSRSASIDQQSRQIALVLP